MAAEGSGVRVEAEVREVTLIWRVATCDSERREELMVAEVRPWLNMGGATNWRLQCRVSLIAVYSSG